MDIRNFKIAWVKEKLLKGPREEKWVEGRRRYCETGSGEWRSLFRESWLFLNIKSEDSSSRRTTGECSSSERDSSLRFLLGLGDDPAQRLSSLWFLLRVDKLG